MKTRSGQIDAFEVYRNKGCNSQSFKPQAILEHVATLWDHEEACKLDLLVSGDKELRGYSAKYLETIAKISVLVVGEEAFYSLGEPSVPVGLVTETAAEALELYAMTYKAAKTFKKDY